MNLLAIAEAISNDSTITVGLLATITTGVGALVAFTFRILSRIDRIEQRIEQAWTKTDQELFELRLRVNNPSIHLPDADGEKK